MALYLPDQSSGNLALVVCPPIGREDDLIRRTYHELSLTVAQRGIPAVFPHLRGHGQSHAKLSDLRLEDWIDDLDAAVRVVERSGHADDVCLLGARFGAALALLTLPRLRSPRALVLWDPPLDLGALARTKGRAVRIRQQIMPQSSTPSVAIDGAACATPGVVVENRRFGERLWGDVSRLGWESVSQSRALSVRVALAVASDALRGASVELVRRVLPLATPEVISVPGGHGPYWSKMGIREFSGLVEQTADWISGVVE